MSEWRRIEVPGPEGEFGYMLVPPDESRARGPFWEDAKFVDHLVYALNMVETMETVGLSMPDPSEAHYEIVFEPAKPRRPRAKKPTTPRRKPK